MGSQQARRWVLRALVFLAVLPLPVVAYALGVFVVARVGAADQAQHLFSSQVVLVVAALLVAGVGGFLIWSTATSLARTTEVEDRLEHVDGTLADRLEESTPLMNSVARMLATIERQTDEINHFAQRLDTAYRELECANARVREFSFTDEVTGLYDRRFFSVRLEEEVARSHRFGHPLSLVLLDLDGFKTVNDELGHLAGDETLRSVGEILLKNSRGIDVVCRYGGDEFAVLLVETPRAGAGLYAERIREILSADACSRGWQVPASFGIASLPEDVRSADDLVRAADEALYAAKRAGKNCVAAYGELGGARPVAHGGLVA